MKLSCRRKEVSMNAVEDRPHQETSAALLSHLQRWFFAVCIVGGTAATLVSVTANPGYYRPHADVASFIAAFATANTFLSQTNVISMIFVCICYLWVYWQWRGWLCVAPPGGRAVLPFLSCLVCFP